MKLNTSEISGVKYLTFDIFEKTGMVRHAFSTRIGGVSEGCYKSLNLWLGSCSQNRRVRDDMENVKNNFIIFSEAVGFDVRNMVFSDQVHGTKLACVGADGWEASMSNGKNSVWETDGLSTNKPNVVLTTFYADCTPLFFLDPIRRVITLAHAGWKGTLGRMAQHAVSWMIENYGCTAGDILCGIGPAIGNCCYTVDQELADRFKREFPDCTEYADGNRLDLKMINRQLLLEIGIYAENIEVSELCTKCNPDLFYSHRGMGRDRGQMAAVMELI